MATIGRPTPSIWGSPSDEAVKMVYDDEDWAIFGSISSESTHIALRVALKAEIPIVNSASTDPTIPETYIPWYFTDLQDDRVQGLTLARRIFTELGLKRVAILRVNSRYGRFGVIKFRDASRRLGHPVVIEQKFMPGDTDFTRALKIIQSSRADAIVLWTDEIPAANILKQMKALGMKQRVFGVIPHARAGVAGRSRHGGGRIRGGLPVRSNAQRSEVARFQHALRRAIPREAGAVCFAGLRRDECVARFDLQGWIESRAHSRCAGRYRGIRRRDRAHDLRSEPEECRAYVPGHGAQRGNHVSCGDDGRMTAKPAQKTAKDAKPPSTPVPYARVGEEGVTYAGPHSENLPDGARKVVLFGPQADVVARSAEMQAVLHGDSGQGSQWALLPVASDQNWGAASTQLVHALMDEHALAIVALDRDAAHLSEQLALKAFVPVVALSEDRKLTSTNVPWIFRLPAATKPAVAIEAY